MDSFQHAKEVVAIPPSAILDNASATASEIDCRGYDRVRIRLYLGATDIAMTALKVQSSATSGGSFADITGATFDGGLNTDGTALALPSATDDNQVCVFDVDLQGQNRFLKVVATFGDGTSGGYIAGGASLYRGQGPLLSDTDYANGGVCRV